MGRKLESVSTNEPKSQPGDDARDGLTHVDDCGRANMVDVGGKAPSQRRAVAEAWVVLDPETCELLFAGRLPKGEAVAVARVAGIQAAKETARLIPLCHSVALSHVSVEICRDGADRAHVVAQASTVAETGVEMEAMCAASVAALTIYDMTKARCRGAAIVDLRLRHKSGGRSGTFDREGTE